MGGVDNPAGSGSGLSREDSKAALTAARQQQAASKQEEARWITACYCPSDFNHYICAVCSDK
eukprot:gene56276-53221_t